MNKMTKNLTICAMFIALISIGAYIRIPVFNSFFTLQLFFVLLVSNLFSAKISIISAFLYMLLGLLGVPVFTNGGGIGYVFVPSFGYIIGFVFAAGFVGYLINSLNEIKFFKIFLINCLGIVIVYFFGLIYVYVLGEYIINSSISLNSLFLLYCFIFLPGDILSAIFASIITIKTKHVIKKII